MHNNKTICLNMIVKNEAHIIASTLENLCNYINFDYWVIVDTGSTDNTKQIISDFFKSKHIKGELHETEWKNFGFNRSDALSKAFNKTDYLLIFDADDRMVGEFVLPTELNLDGYHLKFGDNFSYVRLLLVNNKLHWKFMGVLHEYIICTNENYSCKFENIEGNYHLISGKSGARSNNPNKYRDDALILEKAYKDAVEMKDDIMVRYSFYCAQSYKDAGNAAKSIEWYKKRISHGGWNQEVYYSYITIGQLYAKMNNIESAFYYWALSFDADPERCEGIYYIIKHCREKGNFNVALYYYNWIEKNKTSNLLHKLFVTEDIYKYLLDYEFTIIACYVGQHKNAIPSFHTLFKYANTLSVSLKENIVSNLQFYIKFIDSENLSFFYDYLAFVKNIYLETGSLKKHIVDITDKMKDKFTSILTHYDSCKILSLANSCSKENDATMKNGLNYDIILTITSCKRLDLFEKTINSFLNNCTDVGKITYFFCVDDNSSDEDREKMMKMYPFFNFYFKNSGEKGHRQSMNIIWNKLNEVKPRFYLHLEDDWLFINKRSYVTDSISFLERVESDGIHQILFNKNYAEVINGFNLVGGKLLGNAMDSTTNMKFKLHIKDEANLCGSNCAYWPHFSFRPSIIRTNAVLTLGNFDSPNTFFERDYADKYFNLGYTSAYFNEVNCIHIGKLTSETQEDKKNAYQLNNEEQFSNTKKIENDIKNLYDGIDLTVTLDNLLQKYHCYPAQDFFGSDIFHIGNQSLFDQLLIAERTPECVCFNTLGYFKKKVDVNRMGNLNGCKLYVKKKYLLEKAMVECKSERKFSILNLILFSNENCVYREYYLKMVELQKEYMKSYKSNNNNIIFYFYCYKEDLQEEYMIEDDVIYIKGVESYVPGILEKTIKAFEITKNMEYDFLVRSNISTVIDYSKLDNLLYKIPDDIIYAGGSCRLLTGLNHPYGIHKVYNIPFILGTSIILKKEGVYKLINNKNLLSETIIDDVAIGLFFNHFGDKPYGFDSYYRYNLSCVSNDVIFYRNRQCEEATERENDIINMQNILKEIIERESRESNNYMELKCVDRNSFTKIFLNQSTNQSNESNESNEIIYNKNKIESDYETNNSMLQYGQLSNTDKVTHHEYHKYYEPVLKPYYNSHGSIVEIGLGTGQSLPMWQNLFKHAHIYGVDKEYENSGNDRYTIYKGDQSNVNDLNDLRKSLTDKNVFFINDDGSHIPEHQLLTFNTLFPILKEGGIYIIEDIETSYWTKGECYNYKTRYGYKHPDSIVEIFKDASDIMNREFIVDKTNLSKKILHYDYIESVTFARNCIIIKKNYNANREYRFKIFT